MKLTSTMIIKDPKLLPDHIKRMISHAERHKLGIKTNEEQSQKVEAYNERKLHEQIRQLLNLKGIAYFECRMDKRSHGTVGWPDFTFCALADQYGLLISTPCPCVWECKVGNSKLRPEQEEMMRRLEANGWRVRVIRSLQEAADELKSLGV